MAIWILNFPLPPSVNEYLMPVAGQMRYNKKTGHAYRQGHLVKTKAHADYQALCYQWATSQAGPLQQIKSDLLSQRRRCEELGAPFSLRLDCFFAFEHKRIFTVNGKVERLDADNRLKPCRDALSKVLEIDDKHFFSGICEKVTTHRKESECCLIRISQFTPRTMEQIRSLVGKPTQDTW